MELRVEGNEIRIKADRKTLEDAYRHPGKYSTEDDRTPWEYTANIVYKSLDAVSITSAFYSGFINRVLSCLDAGRIKNEGSVTLATRGEFVNLIREKVTKQVVDLYNQAFYQTETHYLIRQKPKIEPKPDSSLMVVVGSYEPDRQTFMGEIVHKNGDKPHLLPPSRFPHIIDDTIEYLTGFHEKGEGPVYFHNKLATDPNNEQRGALLARIIDLFNKGHYLSAH